MNARKFEVGMTYSVRSTGDSQMIYRWTVKRRTDKSIWLEEGSFGGEGQRRKIETYDSVCGPIEICFPDGKYARCPRLRADRKDG